MVAIGGESDLSVDFRKLYDGVKQKLPSYARPYFVRIVSETDMTGTIEFLFNYSFIFSYLIKSLLYHFNYFFLCYAKILNLQEPTS